MMAIIFLELLLAIAAIGLVLMGGAIFAWLIHDVVERRTK